MSAAKREGDGCGVALAPRRLLRQLEAGARPDSIQQLLAQRGRAPVIRQLEHVAAAVGGGGSWWVVRCEQDGGGSVPPAHSAGVGPGRSCRAAQQAQARAEHTCTWRRWAAGPRPCRPPRPAARRRSRPCGWSAAGANDGSRPAAGATPRSQTGAGAAARPAREARGGEGGPRASAQVPCCWSKRRNQAQAGAAAHACPPALEHTHSPGSSLGPPARSA